MASYCDGHRPHEQLSPFHLTQVLFSKDDPLGLPMAVLSMIPIALISSYVSAIITSRRAWVVLASAGQFMNEVINYILKKYIQHHRPHRCLASGYGMPSSHAQNILYFATVHLGYHTVAQVLAGSVLGVVVAVAWYVAIQRVLKPSGILARLFRLPLLAMLEASDFTTVDHEQHRKRD
ncbi:hypothetical protein SYNPS1DRAFT_12217 [Syncephalis pseudoplumigaleata]|uniref:Dolichyldiphosphatase n=1 Tax=Syncephalis pseudoplumigaleata TaxID=1712513 RepID=A0A4P9Z5B5_9FUNG|nr:hypothetical protein SYNPS1DRAFT_12217 [Syncephalis pseudoplumigaleata]|eukprot:RKP27746.1 hypothetical protein SYNPS1DRAFT_12217 [Syncephalis pseudoplumigaleata]